MSSRHDTNAADGLYGFRWAEESAGPARTTWFSVLTARIEAGFARALSKMPDGLLDSTPVRWVIIAALPYVLRLRFRPSFATAVTGADLDVRVALVVVSASGSRYAFLVQVRDRRCKVTRIPPGQASAHAGSGIIMLLPKLMRMYFGAERHPALLIANGDIKLWGDVFLNARLVPMLGIPGRSLLADNKRQPVLAGEDIDGSALCELVGCGGHRGCRSGPNDE